MICGAACTATPTARAVPFPAPWTSQIVPEDQSPAPQKAHSTLSLTCPDTVAAGKPIDVTDAISPPHGAAATVQPTSSGTWTLTASWSGDDDHVGGQAGCTVAVVA